MLYESAKTTTIVHHMYMNGAIIPTMRATALSGQTGIIDMPTMTVTDQMLTDKTNLTLAAKPMVTETTGQPFVEVEMEVGVVVVREEQAVEVVINFVQVFGMFVDGKQTVTVIILLYAKCV